MSNSESETREPVEREGFPDFIVELAELQDDTIIFEPKMTQIFSRHPSSIKRAVQRGELPHPFRLFGKKAWTAGGILRHLKERQEKVAHEKEQLVQKIAHLAP